MGADMLRTPSVRLADVSVVRSGRAILDRVDLVVEPDERWVLLGANGSGKTTLLSVAGMRMLPTSGTVEVLGEHAGRTDTRVMRQRVAFVSQSLLRQLRPSMTTFEAVISGRNAALETWWHEYSPEDASAWPKSCSSKRDSASPATGTFGTALRRRALNRSLLARALMAEPELLLLDEPAAGLDLAARERLIDSAWPLLLQTRALRP